MKRIIFSLGCCAAACSTSAVAAPMDAFLSANQSSTPAEVQLEAAYDLVNSTVDVLHIRDKDADFSGTNVGDYHGAHVRAGVAVTPRLWLDGAFWQRRIDYRSDLAKMHSWQLAAQYKLLEGVGNQPSVALRMGAWGNYAGELKKSSPTTVRGQTLNSVTVANPKDIQYQLDLIGTSKILEHTELSLFAGAGVSRVTLGAVNATTTLNGCNYNLALGPTEVVGTLAQPCNDTLEMSGSKSNSAFGIDINQEAQYHARYLQGGLMLKWNQEDWQVRAGYQYQTLNRDRIDDTIKSRGGVTAQSNHILMGEVMYKLPYDTAIFVRGQYMTNQFTGEIPFAYNTLTARRFDKRYGILSTGLIVAF